MLLPHNIPVFNNVLSAIDTYKNIVLVSATGTGKSYVITEVLEKRNETALVICPTRRIKNNWHKLTDRVDTVTYHKFHKCINNYIENFSKYDKIIFDEAHRTGAKEWSKSVRKFMKVCDKPIIGLTATHIRFTDNCLNIVDELWNGAMVLGYDIKDAMDKGILPNINYICALYDTTGIKNRIGSNVSRELIGKLDLCIQNMKRCTDILKSELTSGKNKGIIFVDSIDSIESGIRFIKQVFPNEYVWSIHSKQNEKNNEQYIDEFNNADHGYLISVNMMNEGVHVEGIDNLIMLRKTASPLIFLQQLGRGLSSKGKNVKVFDFVSNHLSLRTFTNHQNIIIELSRPTSKTNKKSSQLIIDNYIGDFYAILDEIENFNNTNWTEKEIRILKEYYPKEGKKVADRLPGRSEKACLAMAARLNIQYIYRLNAWTEKEIRILKEYYPKEGSKVADRLPGRSEEACMHEARKLNLSCDFNKSAWTEKEIRILKEYYPKEGKKVADRLPGRSAVACAQEARALGICYEINTNWTEKEIRILKEYYPKEGSKVADRLPGRSRGSCMAMAKRLNLSCNCNKSAWTEKEIRILKEYYPKEGKKVADRLPGRSEEACMGMAKRLKIFRNKK